MKRLAAGLGVLGLVGVGAWQGYEQWGAANAARTAMAVPPPSTSRAADRAPGSAANVAEVVTVDAGAPGDPNAGATPMAQRVAVVGLLNKRNGESRDLTLKPGQAVRVGGAIVRLRACERTAPWEPDELTGAFVQLDVEQPDGKTWRRAFSGWTFKERPALNVVQHPIYDVWAKSCAMSFPSTGPDTVVLSSPAAPGGKAAPAGKAATRPSGARASAPAPSAPAATPPATAPSAAADPT